MASFNDEELLALGLRVGGKSDGDSTAVVAGETVRESLESEAALGLAESAWPLEKTLADGHPATFATVGGFDIEVYEERPSVWRFYPPAGGASSKAVNDDGIREEFGGEVIVVDFTRSGTVALKSVAGDQIVVAKFADGEAHVQEFFPIAMRWHPITLRSGISDWLGDLDDPWLTSMLQQKLALEMPWQHFVAVGTLVRLRQRSAASAVTLARRLLAGDPVDELNKEREWARQLEVSERRVLERMGLTVAESVLEKLRDLESDWEMGEAVTAAEVLDVLHLRDDLASAQLLLEAAGSDVITSILTEIDERGAELAGRWDEEYTLRDERLHRAVVCDPHGWWTSFSAGDA